MLFPEVLMNYPTKYNHLCVAHNTGFIVIIQSYKIVLEHLSSSTAIQLSPGRNTPMFTPHFVYTVQLTIKSLQLTTHYLGDLDHVWQNKQEKDHI